MPDWKEVVNTIFRRVFYFFPIQILLVQLKSNHFLVFIWAILAGTIGQQIGTTYGLHILFLFPEYLGQTGILAHCVLGFAFGGFIVTFNLSSYISNGYKFPFIATLSQPFVKYSFNNIILPLALFAIYLVNIYEFQTTKELLSSQQVIVNILGFLLGMAVVIAICYTYFLTTNKSFQYIFKQHKQPSNNLINNLLHKPKTWLFNEHKHAQWRIETYISSPIKLKLARRSQHYDAKILMQVFRQNHINGSLFEIVTIASIFIIGLFREVKWFEIPSGASVLLLFTIILMVLSALRSWLRNWTPAVFLLAFVAINFYSSISDNSFMSYAYGLDYDKTVEYNNKTVHDYINADTLHRDSLKAIETLENWKQKQDSGKPTMVFINSSGGGLRSALWTVLCLYNLDSINNFNFFDKNIHLVSGSSGGMIGASLYRAYYQKGLIKGNKKKLIEMISKDLLGPVALSLAVNDFFPRIQTFSESQNSYTKDRGFAFERKLIQNSDSLLFKRMSDYKLPEYKSEVPTYIMAPIIANDGRYAIISSQPVSYLTRSLQDNQEFPEALDICRFFRSNNCQNLWYTNALRMGATFPYVLPNITLPTQPIIEIMDAGIKDNAGFISTARYISTFKKWLSKNTKGILILQILDNEKTINVNNNSDRSMVKSLINPMGGFYRNWLNNQVYEQDKIYESLKKQYPGELNQVKIELKQSTENKVSISFHLTQKEKQFILHSFSCDHNQKSIDIVQKLVQKD